MDQATCQPHFRELIKVPHILQNSSMKACLPVDIKFHNPAIIHSLANSVRSKKYIFNTFIYNGDTWREFHFPIQLKKKGKVLD